MIPPRSILAAIDFSESSRVALAFSARLAHSAGATLHLLHAEDLSLGEAARARGADLRQEIREELQTAARSAIPSNVHPASHVVQGAPIPVICDIAMRERADLIVMGTRGRSRSAHIVFGSVTEGVLVRSQISVLVVPGTWSAPRPESAGLSGAGPLVAGIECTTPALAATGAACRLARTLATSVHAVHVVPALGVLERWQSLADAACGARSDEARRELEPLLPELHCQVPIRLSVETGVVADRIAAVAAHEGPHALVVLGRRSPGSTRGAPGDIARRVLAQTASPVLIHLQDE